MKKNLSKVLLFALALVFGASLNLTRPVNAEEADETTEAQTTEAADDSAKVGTSISLTPVSKVLQISSESEYKDTFKVTNEGNEVMEIEVYSAPYSYVYSETEDAYKLGFSNENSFTQIARWITFKDNDGNYVKNPQFTIEPNGSLEIKYKISTPSNIPAGGQYAVIFGNLRAYTDRSNIGERHQDRGEPWTGSVRALHRGRSDYVGGDLRHWPEARDYRERRDAGQFLWLGKSQKHRQRRF